MGNLSWKLHEGQQVIESNYSAIKGNFFVANCARRFGKSFWSVVKALEWAIKCPNSLPRVKIASATAKDLEEFILVAFQLVLDDCPEDIWPGWLNGYVRSKKKFVGFPNGAEIQLVGLDKNPNALRGNYADLVIVDECAYVDQLDYLYSSVIGPMTLERKNSKIIFASTPPATPEHPFQRFCNMAKESKSYIELNIYQNPLMTDAMIEKARKGCLTETDWLREYMCQFVTDQNLAVIPEYSEEIVREFTRPEYFHHLHRYNAMDLGTKVDLTANVYGFYDPALRTLFIEDETSMTGPEMTTPLLHSQIKRKERELWNPHECYYRIADNNNPLLLQDLGILHDLHFLPVQKSELHTMINKLRWLINDGRLVIHPRCALLARCLKGAIWNKERTKLTRAQELGHFDHLMALVYLVWGLDETSDTLTDWRYEKELEKGPFNHSKKKTNAGYEALSRALAGKRRGQ